MSEQPRPTSRLVPRIAVAVVAGAVGVIGLGIYANALSEPVVRAGVPTASVIPPPPKPIGSAASPRAATGSATPPAAPTTSKPTKAVPPSATAKPEVFANSTLTQAPVSGLGKQYRFIVRVETATGLDANQVAEQVAGVLNDPRSWTGTGTVRFALVKDPTAADFAVYVSSPPAAASDCNSAAWVCVAGSKLVLGAAGWKSPAPTYAEDVTGFRRYLVNNAVGTFLGESKATCKKAGRPAPVMAPQTSDLKGCAPNPWPLG